MYRGRPPPIGGYPPPFEGRGPPPRPYPAPGYRDDRNRPRPPYHPGYHEHVPADSYRRSPPRRRYPSPGSGSHRGGEYWAGGPPKEKSSSPRGSVPLDHNLVITVGNELTGPPGSAPSWHHDREHPPRPEYERSRGRSRPRSRSRDQSLDRSRAKSRGRSKSRARSRSRPRSQSRSPDWSQAKSRGRSKSRAKSRGRSKSRSPDRSRAKSRGRSKSRLRSRSRSRSRSRGRSRGRSYSKAASHGRSKSRQMSRSRSRSISSSSSSHSGGDRDARSRKEFKELETARRRKELEEMLSLPTKSILKKRNDVEDSPSLMITDSPRGLEGSNISQVVDQLLLAVKGMEPHRVASVLSELQSDPQMAQRAGLNTEIKEILNLLGGQAIGSKAQERSSDDIDDEEKFLYGDSEEPKPPPASEPIRHHGLDLYGEVTEDTLYGDYTQQQAVVAQTYGLPPGASPHLQAPLTTREMDMRYVSRPTISPNQNISIQVSNSTYPPGTEPLEESERQALEEYDKIQDLLKTIGLDLGVVEISEMAARTKERLHGNKPPLKTPTRCRHYSSGSSDGSHRSWGRRRQSRSGGSTSSSSRSGSRGRGGSWSSDSSNGRRKSSTLPRSRKGKDKDVKETEAEQGATVPQKIPDQKTVPPHHGVPIPTYPPPQVHSTLPNFPPPGYGHYGNYLPYMHQQWPPMYPPPNMTLPPQTSPDGVPPTLPYKQPYSTAVPEPAAKGQSHQGDGLEKGKVSSHDRRVSEEENNESQKQKVLEERENLKQEREIRMKKKEYLMKELERLRKQQGELLRKKRREKGGHKDPLLQEISHLQEEVMTQISNLRKEHEAAEKKRNEIDKVALILGLSPSDRPRRISKPAEDREDDPPPLETRRQEPERSPEGRRAASGSMIKQTSVAPPSSGASLNKPPISAPTLPPTPPLEPFEYYDAGNHWCKNCNVTSGSMFDFFTHLHSKTHRKTLDPYDRPWASTPTKTVKNTLSEEKQMKPAKGSEFLLPVRGFFCLLCKEFYGDAVCAEAHVTTHAHNEKYKKQMYENPLYEQRRNLDRQAGLASETSGKKRKHEDDEKGNQDKEEKSKHKKEKKDKEKKKADDDAVQNEEKSKVKKKEEKLKQDFGDVISLEEDRPSYNKKEEEGKYKCSKKDDKYQYSREEEERGKYSRRDEDDRFKYSREEEYRSRYRRDEDRPKYGPREDEDKYKYGKYPDFRSKYDRERDEGKAKEEKEAAKKFEAGKPVGKPEVSKFEPPPKPHDPPKILSGPSPAMRAKLRKQSLEASKPATAAMTPSFGKFTWKKKENVLAKEAQKVAAEFIKDDEMAVKQNPVLAEDSFAKSVAVAKEIAQKLSGQQNMPPPWVSNRGRIRPNLPAPAAVLRKTAMMGKPAPLNTFLSIRPQNTSLQGPPQKDEVIIPGPLTTALNAQNVQLEANPEPQSNKPGPFEAIPAPVVARPEPVEANPLPPVSRPEPLEVKSVLSEAQPSSSEAKPAPSGATRASSTAKPVQPPMIKIVSDVAAPGVPESEQTHTVFVKPPPFMSMGDGAQKSEKVKSNLAAAKAQDLFDIFYSSQSGICSITKPATSTRAEESSTNKGQLPVPQAQKPKPQCQLLTPSQPAVVSTSPHQVSNTLPSPQTQPESDLQIASVWSLQSTPASTPEIAPSKTTLQTIQPKLTPPAQSEAQSVPQKQWLTLQSESQIPPQSEPAEVDPTTPTQSQSNQAPQIQTEPQSEPQQDKYTEPQSHPETHRETAPEPESKPGPKTRGKATPTKRTPPAPRPVQQTRSQTRYQTRQQQQQQQSHSEPEPEPEPEPELPSADSDSAASDPKGLDTSDAGPGLLAEERAPNEGDPQMMEITSETLDLPSTLTSLDFESDLNFS
ncbi:zinc finger protein 318-like isoform X1 [Chaetodon trifascialis]|uniref:zinc finger protein 318-like isoform X1 n=1 Tax=Chaetodon trifascialis TaxID=109706 RepID=UPI0039967BFE